jgi:hypothetical protein
MGQRHQVYVALPPGHPHVRDGKRKNIGVHHQWLYGHTAARLCRNFLTFVLKAKKEAGHYHPFENGYESAEEMLKAIYSCDPEFGYYHSAHILDAGEPEDPMRGDNNDGITVFDLRRIHEKRGNVSYCFVWLYESDDDAKLPAFVPLSARQYVRGYYPDVVSETRPRSTRMVPLLPNGEQNDPEIRVRAVEKTGVSVITPEELAGIFPTLPLPRKKPELVLPDLGDSPADAPF